MVFGVEGDNVSVHQDIVRSRFGEKFDDERDGLHEHEEHGQDEVGVECELTAFIARFMGCIMVCGCQSIPGGLITGLDISLGMK